MDIEKLIARRDKLVVQLKRVDAAIAKAEKAAREAEQREIVKMIKERGITASQLSRILDANSETNKADSFASGGGDAIG